MLTRDIAAQLMAWKKSKDRRVLLLRGARQVGKTFSVRELAKSFSSFIEVNFLETPALRQFFQGDLSPQPIVQKLEGFFGTSLTEGESLLFLDEVQECPEAITALRFFQEKLPNLHVVAAGSLLEFALGKIPSFGVGRVESLFMYPLSLNEFIRSVDSALFADMISRASPQAPLEGALHLKAVELLKTYAIIGGLPAVVNSYLAQGDLNRCLAIIETLIMGYHDDFAKYHTRISHEKLRATLRASAQQAGKKFVYSHINPGASVSGYDQALDLLCLSGLTYKVYRSAGEGPPIGAQVNQKKFKVLPFDIGIYNRLLDLKLAETLLHDHVTFVNSGAAAELLAGLEIIAHSSAAERPQLYYWDHDTPSGNAEVDYIIQFGRDIVPIEVKAGTKGQMQSMYEFLERKNGSRGIRTSLEPFSTYFAPRSSTPIEVVPLYAIGSYSRSKG
jgi:predicted AAA+ superfamily ATPase